MWGPRVGISIGRSYLGFTFVSTDMRLVLPLKFRSSEIMVFGRILRGNEFAVTVSIWRYPGDARIA